MGLPVSPTCSKVCGAPSASRLLECQSSRAVPWPLTPAVGSLLGLPHGMPKQHEVGLAHIVGLRQRVTECHRDRVPSLLTGAYCASSCVINGGTLCMFTMVDINGGILCTFSVVGHY